MKQVFKAVLAATSALLLVSFASPLSAAAASSSNVTYTNSSNNTTVYAKVGQAINVKLSNLYWIPEGQPGSAIKDHTEGKRSTYWWNHFAPSNPTSLALSGVTKAAQKPGKTKGTLNGTSTQAFKATQAGTATITATTYSYYVCGKKVNCIFMVTLDRYKLTVVVSTPPPPVSKCNPPVYLTHRIRTNVMCPQ